MPAELRMMSVTSIVSQVLLASAALAPFLHTARRARVPIATLLVLLVLLVCMTGQFFDPSLLSMFERSATVAHGQAWRLLTAPWFQDGGVAGSALNLVMLIAIGWPAEMELGRARWICAYAVGALAGGFAGLVWQPIGAGNSVAVLGLAGALYAIRLQHTARPSLSLPAVGALAVAILLVVLHDIHGIAVLAGVLVGLI